MERTQWWYSLVSIAVLNAIWSLVGVLSGDTISVGPAFVWILFGGSFIFLTPVYYYSLYREISTVQDIGSPWRPDLRVWVGGGILLTLIGSILFLNPMTHYVTGFYVLQRFRKSHLAISQSEIG